MFFFLISVALHAQFVNNGATVTIQSGATLRVETDFINTAGTVTNNGTLEVQGNFTNAATFNSPSGSKVRFIGTGASTVASGTAVFRDIDMAKTNNNIVLADPMSVAGELNFVNDNNKVVLGDHNLTLTTSGTIVSADLNEYVATTGTGSLIKPVAGSGTITHEIGDATNYTPLSSAVTGTGYSSATLSARVYTSGTQAKYADATDYISREWNVVANGITDYNNTMTGTYVDADITGNESLIKGSVYTSDWSFAGAANDATFNTVTASTDNSNVLFSGQNFFGKANLKAYLQGPYNAGTGEMTTLLNSVVPANNILEANALTSPYLDAPASVSAGFFLANPDIVDWVKLEMRDPSAPSTSTNNKASAFIKKNGDIVGLDGSSLPRVKNGFPTSVVVLSHRNHLPIRTLNTGLDAVNPVSQHNFSISLGQAYHNPLISTNVSMLDEMGTFLMWAGDINQDGLVKYNLASNDRVLIFNAIGGINQNATVNGYFSEDVNMNGQVKYNLSNNDRVILFNNIGGINQNATISRHN